MTDLPPTDAMLAVLVAAERGSLSAAAVELGVTHGAVSRRVQAVEHWLGTTVFERHGRGVRVTPLGSLFVARARRSLDALASIADDVRTAQRSNAVRLTILPSVARLWLMPRLAGLQGGRADVEIHVLTDHRVLSLDNREADIAIRAGSGGWAGVRAERLFDETLTLVASPGLAERITRTGLASIMSETILYDSDASDWRHWCRETGIRYRPLGGVRRFEDHDLVLAAAEAGLGVALLRRPLADDVLARGRLTAVPGPVVAGERSHFVVTRHNEQRSAVLRLRERLVEAGRVGSA